MNVPATRVAPISAERPTSFAPRRLTHVPVTTTPAATSQRSTAAMVVGAASEGMKNPRYVTKSTTKSAISAIVFHRLHHASCTPQQRPIARLTQT